MKPKGKTKHLLVYEKLRQGIIKGTLKPGQKLVMAALAKKWNLPESGANYTGHIYNPGEESATPAATPAA